MTGTVHGRISMRGLDPDTESLVRDWFCGLVQPLEFDGDRSVLLAAPGRPFGTIKIKGAGLGAKGVQWGRLHRTGPKAPVFDFEGRFGEDVASGHDAAHSGGASFQQVMTEKRISDMLAGAGRPVVPVLGTGFLQHGDETSWFLVFDWDMDWGPTQPPKRLSIEEWRGENIVSGYADEVIRVATELHVIGYHWYLTRSDKSLVWKDLHPYRGADPVSMSALAWVLQVYFALHIRCNNVEFQAIPKWKIGLPPEAVLWPLERLVPGVTLADHAALRREVVIPYMIGPPQDFNPARLARALAANPITAALLARCPPEYERYF